MDFGKKNSENLTLHDENIRNYQLSKNTLSQPHTRRNDNFFNNVTKINMGQKTYIFEQTTAMASSSATAAGITKLNKSRVNKSFLLISHPVFLL